LKFKSIKNIKEEQKMGNVTVLASDIVVTGAKNGKVNSSVEEIVKEEVKEIITVDEVKEEEKVIKVKVTDDKPKKKRKVKPFEELSESGKQTRLWMQSKNNGLVKPRKKVKPFEELTKSGQYMRLKMEKLREKLIQEGGIKDTDTDIVTETKTVVEEITAPIVNQEQPQQVDI
jgi:hypothetical protein